LLETSLEPNEYLAATVLIGKIMSMDTYENLNNEELHLLAKILKVKKKIAFIFLDFKF
jgi:hypothetical protein